MYRPARGGRLCEHFGGYKTINRILLFCIAVSFCSIISMYVVFVILFHDDTVNKLNTHIRVPV